MQKWWQDAVVYQIYPRSFQDSDGDGIGDIPGIISRLDELRDLGIGVIWLSPVYVSPGVDNGYDISDYCDIDPMFGTLGDMDRLIAEARSRGIRIIMDLVINHTSSRHEWFEQSRRRIAPCDDYYIWQDKPNNWTGFFGGGVWEFDGLRGQYYLHLFSKEQPDLNWKNPLVMQEVQRILRFWLDRGVAGFRCDVINILYKQSLESSRKRGIVTGIENYLTREGNHEILRRLRREALDDYDCFTVGETVFVTTSDANDLCAPERKELDMVFAFEHMETDQAIVKWFKRRFEPERFFRVITKWQRALDWNANYLENHDQPRSVSRFGDDGRWHNRSAKMLCTLLLTLRGTPFIYQGQELGMTNFDFESMEQVQDVESHNIYALAKKLLIPPRRRWDMIRRTSRDNARQPVQWDGSPGAGFSTAKPWIDINHNYVNINHADQKSDPDSILNWYKQMIALRAENAALLRGRFRALLTAGPLFVYERVLSGERVLIALNFSGDHRECSFSGKALASNLGKDFFDGRLEPYEAAVFIPEA